eukprot:4217763-Pyramimonas_sp.AAC.1
MTNLLDSFQGPRVLKGRSVCTQSAAVASESMPRSEVGPLSRNSLLAAVVVALPVLLLSWLPVGTVEPAVGVE